MLCPKIKNLANMHISAQAQYKCKDNIIYNVNTVSDLRGLTEYLRLRRRCSGFFGTEGVEGNVHASRAWKGNDQQRIIISRARPPLFPAQ
jgi:hypothetical protein